MIFKPYKSIIFFLLILLLIPSLLLNLFFIKKNNDSNRVVEVVDGDTFQLQSGQRVRLMGVDAPEYDNCGGTEATQKLSDLILNKTVSLEEDVKETFGRTQALVYVGDSFINKIMMDEGLAIPDYRKNSQRDILTQSYHTAKNQKLGIFGSLCQDKTTDLECVIKGNIDMASGKKFYHLPGCSHYDEIVIDSYRGEKYFCSEKEAQTAGFTKASSCP
jgi:micrococcal nuclease